MIEGETLCRETLCLGRQRENKVPTGWEGKKGKNILSRKNPPSFGDIGSRKTSSRLRIKEKGGGHCQLALETQKIGKRIELDLSESVHRLQEPTGRKEIFPKWFPTHNRGGIRLGERRSIRRECLGKRRASYSEKEQTKIVRRKSLLRGKK